MMSEHTPRVHKTSQHRRPKRLAKTQDEQSAPLLHAEVDHPVNQSALRQPQHLTPAVVQQLQSTHGNQFVHRLIESTAPSRAIPVTSANPDSVQRGLGDMLQNVFDAIVSFLSKPMINKELAVTILSDAYKDYVKIDGGTVEVLDQAAFQKKYEEIYKNTPYAWDTYVVPKFGNLEGFAYKGVNYINKDLGSIDVVPHEMLHNNANPNWKTFAGSNINEGTTEYLTIKAVKAKGFTPSHSYPDQEGVIQELVKAVGEDTLLNAYFKGETGALSKAVNEKCKGSWDKFKEAMDNDKWTTAKALVKAK